MPRKDNPIHARIAARKEAQADQAQEARILLEWKEARKLYLAASEALAEALAVYSQAQEAWEAWEARSGPRMEALGWFSQEAQEAREAARKEARKEARREAQAQCIWEGIISPDIRPQADQPQA